jgi:hypothetical protein
VTFRIAVGFARLAVAQTADDYRVVGQFESRSLLFPSFEKPFDFFD